MPPPDLRLSVYVISELPDASIWTLGRDVLSKHPRPRLYGRADIAISAVHGQELKAFRDDDPYRHVNVVGWPSYVDGKDRIKSIAQELARSASLRLLSTPMSKQDQNA